MRSTRARDALDPLGPEAPDPVTIAIIPTFNEQGAIGPTVSKLPRDLFEAILVVDGGSTDATRAEAAAAGATIIDEPRRGYGRACLTGFEHALAHNAEIVLFLDGDGSDAGDLADRLIAPIRAKTADFTLAHRSRAGRAPGSMGPHQVLAGHLIGAAVGLTTGTRYRDMCAFRAIRTDLLSRLAMREMTYGWNLEMQMRAALAGARIREIPMPYGKRVAGHSKVAGNLRGTARATTRILRTLVSVRASARHDFPSRTAMR